MKTKHTPLYDRVIVQRLENESPSKIIVKELQKDKPMRARVIAVGPGRPPVGGDSNLWWVDEGKAVGALIPLTVKVGDLVLIGKYAGAVYEETDPVTFKTTEYVILREDDILTIIDETEPKQLPAAPGLKAVTKKERK